MQKNKNFYANICIMKKMMLFYDRAGEENVFSETGEFGGF